MHRLFHKAALAKAALLVLVALCLVGTGPFSLRQQASAAQLEPRKLKMSNSTEGLQNVSYDLQFDVGTSGLVGSISIEFCSNSPLYGEVCDVPTGMDVSGATIATQSGLTGFTVSSANTTSNRLVITRPPAGAIAGTISHYIFSGIQNPDNAGSLFARLVTYASSDTSGPSTDDGGLALVIIGALGLNAEVPPYLTFCLGESISGLDCTTATEDFSDLGNLIPTATSAAQTQIIIATNASNGYSMWVAGTSMTSGNNVIPAMAGGPAVPGTAQFGMNLRANTVPGIGQDATGPGFAAVTPNYGTPNQFRYNSGDTIASAPQPDDYRKYTVSYVVNVAPNQPGGVYSTTLTYTALANF